MDWELMLSTVEEVPDDVTHIGVRGHWLKEADVVGKNTMAVQVTEYIETTFEHQYLIRNKDAQKSTPLWWMRRRNNFQEAPEANMPEYLYFPPEHVMLLKNLTFAEKTF